MYTISHVGILENDLLRVCLLYFHACELKHCEYAKAVTKTVITRSIFRFQLPVNVFKKI